MRIIIDIRSELFLLYEITDLHLKNSKGSLLDINRIVNYLKKSDYLSILLDGTECIFTGESLDHFDTHLTDGKWIWSSDIMHYVEKHNYILPHDFILTIRESNYKPLKLNDQEHEIIYNKVYTQDRKINPAVRSVPTE